MSALAAAHIDASEGVTAEALLAALRDAGAPKPSPVRQLPERAREALRLLCPRVRGGVGPRVREGDRAAVAAFADGLARLGVGIVSCGPVGLRAPSADVLGILRGMDVRYGLGAAAVSPAGAAILAAWCRGVAPRPFRLVRSGEGEGGGARVRIAFGAPSTVERLWEVHTNLDDCSPQVFDHVVHRLFEAGARDVVLAPVQMKKGRPAVRVEALADDAALGPVEDILLTETPTLGLRRHLVERRTLPREVRRVATPYGAVRVKRALDPRGAWKSAPEYDDCRAAACRTGAPLREVMAAALRAAEQGGAE